MATKQSISIYGRGVRSHSKFKESELNKVLNKIISETSFSSKRLKIKVNDYSDSSKPSDCTSVKLQGVNPLQEIVLKIILEGFSEWWTVAICPAKSMQEKITQFNADLKGVIASFNKEKAKVKPSDNKGKAPIEAAPENNARKADVDEKDSGSKPEKRTRTRTSSVLTDDIQGMLFERWMREYGTAKIFQREFAQIISEVITADINKQSVVRFLEKKGTIKIFTVIDRKPQLEMTPAGIEALEIFKQKRESEKEDKEEQAFYSKVLDFPDQALDFIGKFGKLKTVISKLDEIQAQEEEAKKKISEGEKSLAKAKISKAKILEEIRKIFESIDSGEITELVGLARELSQKIE